jgi:hypothetical protein
MTICVSEGGGLDVGHKDNFDWKIELCWIVVQSSPHPSTNRISRTIVVIMLWRTLRHLTMSWPLKFPKCALILDATPICSLLQYYISIVWCLHHGSSLPYLHGPTLHFIVEPCVTMFGIPRKN